MTVPRHRPSLEQIARTEFAHVRWNVPPAIGPRMLDFFVVCNYVLMRELYPRGGVPPVMMGRN